MPAAVAVPLITGAITGATTIAGAKMASNSAKRAGNIQSRYNDQALAAEREQMAYERAQFEEERARKREAERRAIAEHEAFVNGPELAKLGDLLGVARGQDPFGGASAAMPRETPAVSNTMRLVTLKSPDGRSTRTVASTDPKLNLYLQRGARRVG